MNWGCGMIINEIFLSVDGEVNKWGQGTLTTFIRTQGCNLDCSYCDTPKAIRRDKNEFWMNITTFGIEEKVNALGCRKVTITGGEPLLQKDIFDLIYYLSSLKYDISIETNGTIPIPQPYIGKDNICWIVDYKMEYQHQMKVNWEALSETDWIKFVASIGTIQKVIDQIRIMRKEGVNARMAISPLGLEPLTVIEILKKEKLFDVNLNVQLHKLIGVE